MWKKYVQAVTLPVLETLCDWGFGHDKNWVKMPWCSKCSLIYKKKHTADNTTVWACGISGQNKSLCSRNFKWYQHNGNTHRYAITIHYSSFPLKWNGFNRAGCRACSISVAQLSKCTQVFEMVYMPTNSIILVYYDAASVYKLTELNRQ